MLRFKILNWLGNVLCDCNHCKIIQSQMITSKTTDQEVEPVELAFLTNLIDFRKSVHTDDLINLVKKGIWVIAQKPQCHLKRHFRNE